MIIEEKIRDCIFCLNQIKHYNPDPYYVSHFFQKYVQRVISVYEEILFEANRDLGLFITKKCTIESFEKKAIEKNDKVGLNFIFWFKENYQNEHKSPYANFIKKIITYSKQKQVLPLPSIKILAKQRYQGDPVHGIIIGLKNGKLKSKEELKIEVKRQTPIFLEIINQKRKSMGEPKVNENQVISSTFLEIKKLEDIEIPQACEIYISIMNRFLEDSRKKMKQLTERNHF